MIRLESGKKYLIREDSDAHYRKIEELKVQAVSPSGDFIKVGRNGRSDEWVERIRFHNDYIILEVLE